LVFGEKLTVDDTGGTGDVKLRLRARKHSKKRTQSGISELQQKASWATVSSKKKWIARGSKKANERSKNQKPGMGKKERVVELQGGERGPDLEGGGGGVKHVFGCKHQYQQPQLPTNSNIRKKKKKHKKPTKKKPTKKKHAPTSIKYKPIKRPNHLWTHGRCGRPSRTCEKPQWRISRLHSGGGGA